jgi:hypothetical protein
MRARLPLALFTFAMLASPGCQTVETVYVYVTPTPGADGAVVGPAALPPDGAAPAAQVTSPRRRRRRRRPARRP